MVECSSTILMLDGLGMDALAAGQRSVAMYGFRECDNCLEPHRLAD